MNIRSGLRYTAYCCDTAQLMADVENSEEHGLTCDYDEEGGTCIVTDGEKITLFALKLGNLDAWLCRAMTHS